MLDRSTFLTYRGWLAKTTTAEAAVHQIRMTSDEIGDSVLAIECEMASAYAGFLYDVAAEDMGSSLT